MNDAKVSKSDVKEFVYAAHGNLDKVKQMLAETPALRDLANGNETAMGAACQMKCRDIVEFLLAEGVPMDIYAACVLGRLDLVRAFLDADSTLINLGNKASHNKKTLSFATEHPEILALLHSRGAKQRTGRPTASPIHSTVQPDSRIRVCLQLTRKGQ